MLTLAKFFREGGMASPQNFHHRIVEKGYHNWSLTASSNKDAINALKIVKNIEDDLFSMKREIQKEISLLWDNYREQAQESFGDKIVGAFLGKKKAYQIQKKTRESLARERDRLIVSYREVESKIDHLLEQYKKNKRELRRFLDNRKADNKEDRTTRSRYKKRDSNHTYYRYIQSQGWREKAEEAKARAGNRCQVCNRSRAEVQLDAHHRTYERLGNELPEDITVLCRECHQLYEDSKKVASEDKLKELSKTGFCIRCKKTINLNPQTPYCYNCFKVWKRFSNAEYKEKFCHICGSENTSTMQKPACYTCFKQNREKLSFQEA